MDKVKRERSVNFNSEERDILVSLVFKYKDILENKQSDASSWKNKELAWENIAKDFNARSGVTLRSSKNLRIKYEGLKRAVRKKSAAIRSELYRTGGGRNSAIPLDSTEEKIKSLITLSTDGLESIFDSDVLPQTQLSQDSLGNTAMEELILIPPILTNTESGLIENTENFLVEKIGVETQLDDIVVTPNEKYVPTPSTSHIKWDVTSRKSLKSRRHPALIDNIKPLPLDKLAEAKLELVQLQKKLLEAEIVEKKKEWEFKDMERKWKEEEFKLKLEKLRRELKD